MMVIVSSLILSLGLKSAQPADFPAVPSLPNPFRFLDGSEVRTRDDWVRRRAEIVTIIQQIEYGRVAPAPSSVQMEAGSLRTDGTSRQFRLTVGDGAIPFRVRVHLPSSGDGPYPVVLRFGLDDRLAPIINRRGYAYVCFEHRELDPDTEGYDVPGPAQVAYPDFDWGSIAVWAWGASRVLDYLETVPEIDAEKCVITGHSRTGKAALLAGALDERFAIVVPNGSGCGGVGSFRGAKAGVETLELITLERRWKSWFHSSFGDFAKQVDRLPFDQHFMRTLIAPRVLLSTDGLGDQWANPPGTQKAWLGAQPVFDFLGVAERNLCHFREGGHDQREEDLEILLEVADWRFRNRPMTVDFSLRPEREMTADWDWRTPPPTVE